MTTPQPTELQGAGELPKLPGFYWWRLQSPYHWRMLEIKDIGDRSRLIVDDVEYKSFTGRALWLWHKEGHPVGEWIIIQRPNPTPNQP